MIWSPSDGLAAVVDGEAAVGVPVERDAGRGAVRHHGLASGRGGWSRSRR
jgi:hypothetical protein